MNSNLQVISHSFGENIIEQRVKDGFINVTAMCVAHNKKLDSWLRTNDTLELFFVLYNDLKSSNLKYSDLSISDPQKLSATKYAKLFPELIVVKQGSPEFGGGVWLHPDLALQLDLLMKY